MSGVSGGSDDVTIIDLFRTLRNSIHFIIIVILGFAALGVLLALTTPPLYKSSILLSPASESSSQSPMASIAGGLGSLASIAGLNTGSGASVEKNIAILKSRQFTREFLNQDGRLQILFSDMWDQSNSVWRAPEGNVLTRFRKFLNLGDGAFSGPSDEQIYNRFNEARSVGFDNTTGLVTLSIQLPDPYYAQLWANEIVSLFNAHVRQKDVEEAEQGISYLESQVASTSLVDMKKILYALMESKVQTIMLATVRDEYVFKIVDPAVKPEAPSAPKKMVILIGFTIGGAITATLLVLIRQMVLLVRNG